MLATAFTILHYRMFVEQYGPIPEPLASKLAELQLMELTLFGAHGSTAQYWMTYIKAVDLYLLFHRSCRTNDLGLFTYALGQMRYMFFAGNKPNYYRWMVRFHMNLMNVDKTHPGLKQILENGALSIRLISNSFSRAAVDITLEQMVNADAASRKTGIAAFGTDAARRRWMITRSMRSAIVGNLLRKAGLKSGDDVVKELKPYRIKKDTEDIQKLLDGIQSRMNPFDLEGDINLYCLSTGKKVDDKFRDELVSFSDRGREWCEEFRQGCLADHERFERPIPRRKVKNFASAAIRSKTTAKEGKVIVMKGTRDLLESSKSSGSLMSKYFEQFIVC